MEALLPSQDAQWATENNREAFSFFGVFNSASVDFSAYLTDESALGGGVVTANVTLFQHGPVLMLR